jgi:hypothetical protein
MHSTKESSEVTGFASQITRGASVGAMLSGGGMTLFFKLSELATDYKHMSPLQIARFVAITFVLQFIQVAIFLNIVISWYNDH